MNALLLNKLDLVHRIDLFASLSLENEFDGNLAFFDQNLAIQFVKKHIHHFCGDPERVTLFGHSLGSMFVSMHLISRHSRDLINNAILQSGTALFNASDFFEQLEHSTKLSQLVLNQNDHT